MKPLPILKSFAMALGLWIGGQAMAASTDLSYVPLFTSSSTGVKSNILFILDDSGSMDWEYLPDDAPTSTSKYGYWSSQCNGVAYNPAVTYTVPVKADGTSYPAASFSAAKSDGFSSSTSSTNLKDKYYYAYTGSQEAMSYEFTSSGLVTSSTFYKECNSSIGSSPGSGVFTKVTLTSSSAEAQNYANWYTYYRSRMQMMKSATGLAFSSIDSQYRVGFKTISDTLPTVNIKDFDATQKSDFYAKLYAAQPSGSTPLRGALSTAGQYFAKKARSQTYDPVQYSCQKNFAILSTDGYWNTGSESSSFGPFQLNNSTEVGQQDGIGTPRPMFDGTAETTSTSGGRTLKNSRLNQCSSISGGKCTITVTTSSNHRFTTGDVITISGVSPSVYNGSYVIDVTGNKTFTYELVTGTVPANDSNAGSSTLPGSTTTGSSGGSTNSLADVAMYYYQTDLRTSALGNCTGSLGTDVCSNNVTPGSVDAAPWQHMTTYTLGLGNSGLLSYDPNYLTQSSGDYFDIRQGVADWPVPGSSKSAENVDDLWHAAVNGRGRFFSAQEPSALATSLSGALDSIRVVTGTAAAAATSSLQPVEGDNDVYVGQFTSNVWTGDVSSFKIDPASGAISTTPSWSAQAQLDAMTYTDRKIYYAKNAGALSLFNNSNLGTDGLQSYFSSFCSKAGANGGSAPEQCATLSASDKTAANSSSNLVNYLRGDKTLSYYRGRESRMGDVVNASPLFVGKPSFRYVDSGYTTFASTAPASTRAGIVYVAANDGMLHALDRTNGNELWAFIPKAAMPNLYKLADQSYASNHFPMLDGTPVMGDIFVPGSAPTGGWKTILVGGMNAGGRSYYALDITDPTAPKLLWEFSDDNLGLSFGNPIITKRSDGTWVVLVASGYNNNIGSGDGNGHLFVLNAYTGAKIADIPTYSSGTTKVGDTTTPSGLAKINAYITSDENNLAEVVYGGDLLGNLWRFDINAETSTLFAQLKRSDGTAQPITTKPSLAEISYSGSTIKVVYVGTGKYLGNTDLADTSTQTIYALKDTRSSTGLGNVRTATDASGNPILVAQTAANAASATFGNIVNVTANPVNWNTRSGWYIDLPTAGERVNISPHLVLSTLFVGTNTPKTDACTVGGTSLLYQLDISTGGAAGGGAAATSLGNVLVMGMTSVLTGEGSGAGKVTTIVTRSDGTLGRETGDRPTVRGTLKRTSWRVLK